ncbi:MAG: hypothetical protein H6Q05_1065 [Acidobacteria bacterium]|nr:hypothetical protein [Acidobacteriota bacterium]
MRVLLLFALLVSAPAAGRPANADDPALLPPDGFQKIWRKSEKTRIFTSSDLYGYIDGGAEIFLEFGFEQLTVQPYASPNPSMPTRLPAREIQVEIYRMKDPVAATGIYLMNCGTETPAPAFPERHTRNEFQLLFKKDRHYVIINNVDGDKTIQPDVIEFARHIASRLPGEKAMKADQILPKAGLDTTSVRLIRGPYALQSVFTLGEGDILQLGRQITAVAGNYRDANGKHTLILADYPDEQAARRTFQHVLDNLDSYLKVESRNDRRLVFRDSSGEYGTVSIMGVRMTIQLHLAKPPR